MDNMDSLTFDSSKVNNSVFSFLKVETIDENRLKIDYDTTLEFIFKMASIMFLLLGTIALITYFLDEIPKGSSSLLICASPLAAAAVSFILYKLTDNYFIIDFTREKLMYHFKFLFIKIVLPVEELHNISNFATESFWKSNRSGSWYEYAIFALTKKGRKIRLSNNSGKAEYNTLSLMKSDMEVLSNLTDIPVMPGGVTSSIKFQRNDTGEYEAKYEIINNQKIAEKKAIAICIGVIIFFVLLFLFLSLARKKNYEKQKKDAGLNINHIKKQAKQIQTNSAVSVADLKVCTMSTHLPVSKPPGMHPGEC